MREIKYTKPPGFPHQLVDWQERKKDVIFAISTFKKYKEEADAVIAESPFGWAIFTTGKLIAEQSYRSPYRREK